MVNINSNVGYTNNTYQNNKNVSFGKMFDMKCVVDGVETKNHDIVKELAEKLQDILLKRDKRFNSASEVNAERVRKYTAKMDPEYKIPDKFVYRDEKPTFEVAHMDDGTAYAGIEQDAAKLYLFNSFKEKTSNALEKGIVPENFCNFVVDFLATGLTKTIYTKDNWIKGLENLVIYGKSVPKKMSHNGEVYKDYEITKVGFLSNDEFAALSKSCQIKND